MPDPITILTAMAVAAAVASVLLLIFGWPWRTKPIPQVDAGWVLGLGAGLFLGCWLLGNRPHWPLREDQDRLLGLVLPAVVFVELLAAFSRVPRWLIWPCRAAVVLGVAPVLLHGTSYLSDQNGPGTAEWSTMQAALILGGLAASLAIVWSLLALLVLPGTGRLTRCAWPSQAPRPPSRSCSRDTPRAARMACRWRCSRGSRRHRFCAQVVVPRHAPARRGGRRALLLACDRPVLRRAQLDARHPLVREPAAGLAARVARIQATTSTGTQPHPCTACRTPGFRDPDCRGKELPRKQFFAQKIPTRPRLTITRTSAGKAFRYPPRR